MWSVRRELVAANSGRRHYRLISGDTVREVRIHHDRKGWRYRFQDGQESDPYETQYAAELAAESSFRDWLEEQERLDRQSQRGVPPFPGARRKLHGVVVEWGDSNSWNRANMVEVHHYSLDSQSLTGELTLSAGREGLWRYELRHPAGAKRSPTAYATSDAALDAAVRAFFVIAKRARKPRVSGTDSSS